MIVYESKFWSVAVKLSICMLTLRWMLYAKRFVFHLCNKSILANTLLKKSTIKMFKEKHFYMLMWCKQNCLQIQCLPKVLFLTHCSYNSRAVLPNRPCTGKHSLCDRYHIWGPLHPRHRLTCQLLAKRLWSGHTLNPRDQQHCPTVDNPIYCHHPRHPRGQGHLQHAHHPSKVTRVSCCYC